MTTTQAALLEDWLLLHQAHGLIYKHLDHCAAKAGSSAAMAMPLLMLNQVGHPVPLSRLARLLVQEAQSVTSLIDRLESKGLVRREPDKQDRRVINVVLTPTGEKAVEALTAAFHDALAGSFASLSTRQSEVLRRGLGELRGHGAEVLRWSPGLFDGAAR